MYIVVYTQQFTYNNTVLCQLSHISHCNQLICVTVLHLSFTDNEAMEGDGDDSGRPTSRQSRTSADLGGSRTSRRSGATLDQFTGDSLLHYSYSIGAGLGGLSTDAQLGEGPACYRHNVQDSKELQPPSQPFTHTITCHFNCNTFSA